MSSSKEAKKEKQMGSVRDLLLVAAAGAAAEGAAFGAIWSVILLFVGDFGTDFGPGSVRSWDSWLFGHQWTLDHTMHVGSALALARVVPGARSGKLYKVGPAGARLLRADTCLGGLLLGPGSSWEPVFEAIGVNAGLRRLSVSKTCLTEADLLLLWRALATNQSIEELRVLGKWIGMGLINEPEPAPESATDTALGAALEANSTLRILDLNRHLVNEGGGCAVGRALARNHTLHTLLLQSNGIGDAAGSAIAAGLEVNTGLRTLNVACNPTLCDGEGLVAIAQSLKRNCTLRSLIVHSVRNSRYGMALAEALRENKNIALAELHLPQDTQFGDDDGKPRTPQSPPAVLGALETNRSVRTLSINLDGPTLSQSMHALGRTLEVNGCLQVLRIGQVLDGPDLGPLCAALATSNSTLRVLDLYGVSLQNDGGVGLAGALATNRGLEAVNLGRVQDAGPGFVPALVAALAVNKTLLKLNLGGSYLPASDWAAIAQALHTNNTVRELDVFAPSTSDGEEHHTMPGPALAQMLVANGALKYIRIHVNNFVKDSAPALLDAIASSSSLRTLHMTGDTKLLARAHVLPLERAVEAQGSLRKIIFGDCPNVAKRSITRLRKAGKQSNCIVQSHTQHMGALTRVGITFET